MREILEYCERQRDWLRELIESLVRLESPTTDRFDVDACGAELAYRLEALGGRVSRLMCETRGNHVRAEFGSGDRQVLLLGHIDTVWPLSTIEFDMPLVEREGRLYGPGVFDMKAGVALGVLATRAVLEVAGGAGRRIVMLWTTDEEMGSETSRTAIEEDARRSDAVLVLEPSLPGGALKTSRKGVGDFALTVHGVSAHAGLDPEKGASAVDEIARQILAVRELEDLPSGVSVNVGRVEGGVRSNVVAQRATAHVDVRAATVEQARALEARVLSLTAKDPRTTVSYAGGFARPPMERTAGVARLFGVARQIAVELGIGLDEGAAGGASDGNFTAALGVPTLDGLGAIGDGAHARHEHVELASLPHRAALIAGLIMRAERA